MPLQVKAHQDIVGDDCGYLPGRSAPASPQAAVAAAVEVPQEAPEPAPVGPSKVEILAGIERADAEIETKSGQLAAAAAASHAVAER